jgi:hypothetical protein
MCKVGTNIVENKAVLPVHFTDVSDPNCRVSGKDLDLIDNRLLVVIIVIVRLERVDLLVRWTNAVILPSGPVAFLCTYTWSHAVMRRVCATVSFVRAARIYAYRLRYIPTYFKSKNHTNAK